MNRTELKLVKSLASLAARHSLRDWRTVAKLLGVNISVPRLRSAIATVRAIEAEERAISILDLYPRRITSSKKSGKKRIDSSTLREAAPMPSIYLLCVRVEAVFCHAWAIAGTSIVAVA